MRKTCRTKKDPCKICFDTVTKKTGVQCQGACRKWFHFECLNYTPGKIRDIKAGFIKIMCPCPDCTSEPKEILVNPPYTCKNQKCPANSPRKCESLDCPLNSGGMVCSKEQCSKYVNFDSCEPNLPPCDPILPYGPSMQGMAQYGSSIHGTSQYGNQGYSCNVPKPCSRSGPSPYESSQHLNVQPGSICPAGCSSSGQLQSGQSIRVDDLRQILQPRGSNYSLSEQPCKMKSQSCCCVSKCAGTSPLPAKKSLSDSRIKCGKKRDNYQNASMECALEQMCNTVGILTQQIRDLMCKLMDRGR